MGEEVWLLPGWRAEKSSGIFGRINLEPGFRLLGLAAQVLIPEAAVYPATRCGE